MRKDGLFFGGGLWRKGKRELLAFDWGWIYVRIVKDKSTERDEGSRIYFFFSSLLASHNLREMERNSLMRSVSGHKFFHR